MKMKKSNAPKRGDKKFDKELNKNHDKNTNAAVCLLLPLQVLTAGELLVYNVIKHASLKYLRIYFYKFLRTIKRSGLISM